jgi:hypothetical protein
MLRRLLVGAAIIAAVAGLPPALQGQPVASASPANAAATLQFAYTVTPGAEIVYQAESDYFSSRTDLVWAILDFYDLAPGTRLTYILRANGRDYRSGTLPCCGDLTSGRLAFPITRRDDPDRTVPGARWDMFVYAGGQQIAEGSFGVRGTRGLDNDNDH